MGYDFGPRPSLRHGRGEGDPVGVRDAHLVEDAEDSAVGKLYAGIVVRVVVIVVVVGIDFRRGTFDEVFEGEHHLVGISGDGIGLVRVRIVLVIVATIISPTKFGLFAPLPRSAFPRREGSATAAASSPPLLVVLVVLVVLFPRAMMTIPVPSFATAAALIAWTLLPTQTEVIPPVVHALASYAQRAHSPPRTQDGVDGSDGNTTDVSGVVTFAIAVVVTVVALLVAIFCTDATTASARPPSPGGSGADYCGQGGSAAPLEESGIEVKSAVGGFGLVQRAQREAVEGIEREVEVLPDLAEAG
mmetsp:Transcript_33600/g.81234  ORF Transcript_33600/g.81234 Transcript_33600/m.81234 type:complete len:302 (-) Transcript_33600:74-979(-)